MTPRFAPDLLTEMREWLARRLCERAGLAPDDPCEWRVNDGPTQTGRLWQTFAEDADALLASPSAGRLGAEALERAAEACWGTALKQAGLAGRSGYTRDWKTLHEATRILHIARMRAAFEAAGLPVEGGAE